MAGKQKTVSEYLGELKRDRKEKPDQVRDALEIYTDLWERAIERGIVGREDDMDTALSKIDEAGGLYQAAEG